MVMTEDHMNCLNSAFGGGNDIINAGMTLSEEGRLALLQAAVAGLCRIEWGLGTVQISFVITDEGRKALPQWGRVMADDFEWGK